MSTETEPQVVDVSSAYPTPDLDVPSVIDGGTTTTEAQPPLDLTVLGTNQTSVAHDPRPQPNWNNTTSIFDGKHDHGRPFLIVRTYLAPARGMRTHRKGWSEAPNSMVETEHVDVMDCVPRKRLLEADVVIDIVNRKVIKSRLSLPPETTVDLYLGKYQDQIARGVRNWAAKMAQQRLKGKRLKGTS